VGAAPWTVRVDVPGRAALAAARGELARDAALGALTLALALVLALGAARRISRPLRALAADAEALAAGERPAAPGAAVETSGELGALSSAFEHMAGTIAARTAALNRSEQRHRLLFEACPLPTYLVDVGNYNFLAVNDATIAQYGYTREEFTRLTLVDLRPADDRLLFLARRAPARRAAATRRSWRPACGGHERKDGRCSTSRSTRRAPSTRGARRG
jgi:PAS domain S-box-containing protein